MKKWPHICTCCMLFSLILASGCIHMWERQVVTTPQPEPRKALLPSENCIDERIPELKKILKKNGLSKEDKEIASELLNTYIALKDASTMAIAESEYRGLIQNLSKSLTTLDKQYFTSKRDDTCYKGTISVLAEKEKQIHEHFLSGDYKGVIERCLEIKESFGPDAFTPETALYLSMSLAREGKVKEAADIGEKVVNKLENSPDFILLKIKIMEWLLQQGHLAKANDMREKLSETLEKREALLNDLGIKIKYARKTKEALPPPTTGSGLDSKADQVLTKVRQLTEEHRFAEARALLALKEKETEQEGPDKHALEEGFRCLEKAEEMYLEEKISMLSEKKDTLETAKKFFEEEKFEKTLSCLESLNPMEEEKGEIRALKEQTIEKIINRERNKAAKIFLAAKNTKDMSKKKEYLLACHKKLQSLMEQYPASPLINKINSHIKIVEEEIERLE